MKNVQQLAATLILGLSLSAFAGAGQVLPSRKLGETELAEWSGVKAGRLAVAGTAEFRFPTGPRGWYSRGFRVEHDGAEDFRPYMGLRVDVVLPDSRPVELTATLSLPAQSTRCGFVPETRAVVTVVGEGAHRVTLPWSAFDFQQAQPAFLKFIEKVSLAARYPDGGAPGAIRLKDAALVQGESVSLRTAVRGRSAPAGGSVEYELTAANCSDRVQFVTFAQEKYGWEHLRATIEPKSVKLEPGESAKVTVRVEVPVGTPAGAQEKQVIKAIGNGDAATAARVELVTASALPHPYIVHTPDRWKEVKEKAEKYEWARKAADVYIARARQWTVPELATEPVTTDTFGLHLFTTAVEKDLMAAGIAYQLTGETDFAEKVRTFLLRLSDPDKGYPATLRGCNQALVQEGHFFQHIAMAYDMVLSSGLFSDADKRQIENTFRAFIETIDFETSAGAINNWNLSEICGALYCSLAIQDLASADRFFKGPGGIVDQLGKGVLDDGWWYECAISYNVWCASEFSQVAIALEPWGINFRDMAVPVSTSPNYSIQPWALSRQYGMSFDKWGPLTKPWVSIKRMWDALPNFIDYRGVMFGVNDATERRLAADAYDLAYYLYRDPVFAALVKRGGERDLLYGVPELPAETPEKFRDSAYADNVGVAMLRSRAAGRPINEQIQAVLHYGTHGGYHGHFDRTGLLHLSRYGRSFYNPEAVWFGYPSYMYKFYVQNSTSKNMVVVDRKMQEPVESKRTLFHTGEMMQAVAVETVARWSAPPYGGMVYPEQGYASFKEKSFAEGRSLPIPENPPAYGTVTDFTEPVLQRRLMVVTDDYVLLADYLKGGKEHDFESLLQMKGFQGFEGDKVKLVRHDAQWDPNPILDAQFVTDADWYSAKAPVKASFEMRWGPGSDNEGTRAPESEPGVLKLDVRSLWPSDQTLMVATMPEDHGVEKRLYWKVRGDGRELAQGKTGAWILGSEEIDLPIGGVGQLELETRVEASRRPSVFWASARVVLRDGRELPLSQVPAHNENVEQPKIAGKDFFGGPIKVSGNACPDAISGEPADPGLPALLRFDLSGMDAVRFKAVLGSDYPLGDESQRRKTYASKVRGSEAAFLTLIEPHEGHPVVTAASASGPGSARVELADGRIQEIRIAGLDQPAGPITVDLTETRDGKVLRSEKATSEQPPQK